MQVCQLLEVAFRTARDAAARCVLCISHPSPLLCSHAACAFADYGGYMRQNEAGENFTTVALAGVHDSDAINLPDNLLEATGTYALCHAEYIPGDYTDCLTWHPFR